MLEDDRALDIPKENSCNKKSVLPASRLDRFMVIHGDS